MKIVGFGACMIGGYPFEKKDSFLTIFSNKMREKYQTEISEEIVSFGGFPVKRAQKYLESKVLVLKPDLIILQFGPTDSTVELKKSMKSKLLPKSKSGRNHIVKKEPYEKKLSRSFEMVVKYCICRLFGVKPNSGSLEGYIVPMEEMINKITDLGIQLIILSPFFGDDKIQNYWSSKFTNHLNKISNSKNVIIVNCFSIMSKCKLQDILLCDGMHLSQNGHELIAQSIFECYMKENERNTFKEESQLIL